MQTFDPKLVVLTFMGVPITGYADDTFINAERDEDAFNKNVGAQGDVARVKTNNKSGSVTIVLQQTSLSNDFLSGIAAVDENLGTGVGPLMGKDIGGTTVMFSAAAWIRKLPATPMSKELQTREWIIDCGKLELNVGGNALFGI